MPESPFGLTGNDYWTDPWMNSESVFQRFVFDEEFGVYIDAPAEVDLNDHGTIPMPFLYSATQRDANRLDVPNTAKLVVVDRSRQRVHVSAAIEPEDNSGPPTGPVDMESVAPTSFTDTTDLVARGAIRDVGEYITTVIMGELVSNRVRTCVKRSNRAYEDPEVERFIDEQRAAAPPRMPAPIHPPVGDPYPVYVRSDASPPVPDEVGIEVRVERVVPTGPSARAVLAGSFRLPARVTDVLPANPESAAGGRPSGFVPITLMIVGTTDLGEKVTAMRVPTWDPVEGVDDSATVTGYFTLDLFQDRTIAATAQTNFIYLIADEVLSGPHHMAVVTPEMLQR